MNARISRFDRFLGYVPWAIGALFGAIALHLLAVLALPALAPGGAYRKLALPLPPGEKALIARAGVGAGGPAFADPFAALAVCRFDLAQGPLRLKATAPGEIPVSVSVRLADGTIVYSANDRQTPHGKFSIRVMTQAQSDALEDADQEGADKQGADAATDDELRLVSPGLRGFAVFRALSPREGDYEAAAAAREGFECSIERAAP